MKVMSREFTTTEKILLVILGIVLLGLIYYRFVYITTGDMLRDAKLNVETKQTELELAKDRLERYKKIEAELDELELSDDTSRMESYNNSKRETAFLNQVLSGVSDYAISFSDITRNGDQIRRSFTLQFRTSSYKQAVNVVRDLTRGEYRCLVDDINYSLSDNNDIYINLEATFFETMVGGTPDAALPKDESKQDDNAS